MKRLLAMALLLAGCSEGADVADGATAVPSSGATLTEELRIDGMTHDLVPIRWLTVAPDGTIAVSQDQDHRIRFFGPAGMPAGSFGARGSGPGEFQFMSRSGWLGDTLWVVDQNLGRVTFITPQRTLGRDQLVPARPRFAPVGKDSAEFATVLHIPMAFRPMGRCSSRCSWAPSNRRNPRSPASPRPTGSSIPTRG